MDWLTGKSYFLLNHKNDSFDLIMDDWLIT